mmetsp:Transcript_334/g.1331  ORF Transcript_334/g.1331 Transcript_334/m.1331 type:complete len:288 (+) Transcript_334:1072-1935(+)
MSQPKVGGVKSGQAGTGEDRPRGASGRSPRTLRSHQAAAARRPRRLRPAAGCCAPSAARRPHPQLRWRAAAHTPRACRVACRQTRAAQRGRAAARSQSRASREARGCARKPHRRARGRTPSPRRALGTRTSASHAHTRARPRCPATVERAPPARRSALSPRAQGALRRAGRPRPGPRAGPRMVRLPPALSPPPSKPQASPHRLRAPLERGSTPAPPPRARRPPASSRRRPPPVPVAPAGRARGKSPKHVRHQTSPPRARRPRAVVRRDRRSGKATRGALAPPHAVYR